MQSARMVELWRIVVAVARYRIVCMETRPSQTRSKPRMVVEVVSPSSAARDYGDKAVLYERLSVKEYLIVDPGEPPEGDSRGYLAQLVLYRLQSDSNHVRVEGEGDDPNRRCAVQSSGVWCV
ncbi:MAG: Uma2 family endonuclease [Caldilineaceae bacterium SB0666_bin_21]|nr:Uma2 family endonuclease [Caldilineaceae bacterium SB0666_bin_21]